MLSKSAWFVFIVTVLAVCIGAAPNGYKDNNARRVEAEGLALPVFKRQDRPWRNETRTSVPPTTTREPFPVSLSSESITEQSKSTSISKNDQSSSVVVPPTRSLSSSPEVSPSEPIGPITRTRNDVSSTSVVIGPSVTLTSSFKQEQSSAILVSSRTPQPAESSSQVTSLPKSSSQVTPVPESSSQVTPVPESSSQVTPVPESSSQVTPVPESSSVQRTSSKASHSSTGEQASTPQRTPTPTSTSAATSSLSLSESSHKTSHSSVSQVATSTVEPTQKVSLSVVPSSSAQGLSASSIASSKQESPSPASTPTPTPQQSTSSWIVVSSLVTSASINAPSPVTSPVASQPAAPISSSRVLTTIPTSQSLSSQMVSSGIMTSSAPVSPLPSDQISLSLSRATSMVEAGFGTSQSPSSSASSLSPVPSNQTPTSSSAISPLGTSQGLPSSLLTVASFTAGTISPIVVSSFISSSATVVSPISEAVSSSVTSSRLESSAYVSATETWTPSPSSTVSATSLVLPTASTEISTLSPSGTMSTTPSIMSSSSGGIPVSEASNDPSPSPSISLVSMSVNNTLSVASSALAPSTTLVKAPSDITMLATITLTISRSFASATVSTSSTALNPSTSLGPSGKTSVTVASKTSLLASGSPLSLSFTVAVIPTSNLHTNGTSATVPHVPSESVGGHQGWNISSRLNAAYSTSTIKGAAFPTGFIFSSQTSQVAGSSNSTVLLASHTSTATLSTNTASTLTTAKSDAGVTRTASATVSLGAPTTSTAVAALPPPPLTTPQKAGVAVAGTAGLLLALVAAVYLTRRHYIKKERRSSTGSIYPKIAYLYDPPTGGSGRETYADETLMSGGSSGMPLMGHSPMAPTSSPNIGYEYNTGASTMRFSDPGNPFRDPDGPLTPTNTAAAFSAAIKGYTAAPQRSPSVTDFPTMQPSRDLIWPSSSSIPLMSDARLPNRSSILSEIASMAYNPNVYSNASASRYERLSPYGFHQNHSLPCVRETTYTDSVRDPFEHDLPLQVDFRTETPDSVTIYAPPAASTAPARATPSAKVQSKNPWASSMLESTVAQLPHRPLSRLMEQSPISPDATIVASERFSLKYDNDVGATYIAPSPKLADNGKSPISPPPGPVHRGWDEFKRWSAEKVIPSPVALSPPLRHGSPPPSKKKSLPQLRRKEGTLFSSAEATQSTDRLPLRVKVPFTNHKKFGVENTRLSQFPSPDARSRNDDSVRSPDSTFHHSVHSLTSMIAKKRSGDLEFACAGR